jgi:hypothetical protein
MCIPLSTEMGMLKLKETVSQEERVMTKGLSKLLISLHGSDPAPDLITQPITLRSLWLQLSKSNAN